MEMMRNGSETNICNLCRSFQCFQCADTTSPCLRWSFSLSLSLQSFFNLSLFFEGSLVAGWLCYHPFTNMQELLLPFFCMGVRFIKIHIYTLSLYNFFNFSHLFSFEYIHFFPTIHKFSHLPPSTTNQPSLSLNFTWCQNKQLWI